MELMNISFSYDGVRLTSVARVESKAVLAGILPGLFKVYEVRIQGVTEKEICRRITDRLSGMAVDICTELNRWALEQPEEQTMLAPDPDGKEEAEELVEDLPF